MQPDLIGKPMDIKKNTSNLVLAALLLLTVIIYWWPFWVGSTLGPSGFGWFITGTYLYHIKYALTNFHSLPLFAPVKLGGTYLFHLNAECPSYAPFNIFALFLSIEFYVKFFLFVHLLAGIIGFYLLNNYFKVNKWVTFFFSSVIFFSGYISARVFIGHFMVLPILFLPWPLYFFVRSIDESRYYKYIFLSALSLTFIFISGGNHALIWSLYVLIVFSCYDAVMQKRAKAFIVFFGVSLLCVLFSSFKMFPGFIEYSDYRPLFLHGYTSIREFTSAFLNYPQIAWSHQRSYPGDPHAVGWWEMYAYTGIVPFISFLFVSPLFFFKKFREKYSLHLLVIALFFLLLTISDFISVFNKLSLPGLIYERHTTRMIIVSLILLSVGSGIVITRLIERSHINKHLVPVLCTILFAITIYDYWVNNAQWMNYKSNMPYQELAATYNALYRDYDVILLKGADQEKITSFSIKNDGVDVTVPALRDAKEVTEKGPIEFNGKDTYAVVKPDSSLFPEEQLTYSAWINVSHSGKADTMYIMNADKSGNVSLNLSVSGKIVFSIKNDSTVNSVSAPITRNKWYHVAGTYDGKSLRLYLNGELKATEPGVSGRILYDDNKKITLGGNFNGSHLFEGSMDHIAIWSDALTGSQVKIIYTKGRNNDLTRSYSNQLHGYWHGANYRYDAYMVFNDKDSNVKVPSSPSLRNLGKGSFTIISWFNSLDRSGQGNIFGNVFTASTPSLNIELNSGGNGAIRFYLNNGKNVIDDYYGYKYNLNDGLWHFASVVRERDGELKMYVDGQLDRVYQLKNANLPIIFADNDWRIGIDNRLLTRMAFGGKIDTVAVWSRALSSEVIARIYSGGRAFKFERHFRKGLTAYWRLGSAHNYPVVKDLSGNGHNGIVENSDPEKIQNNSYIIDSAGDHTALFNETSEPDLRKILIFRKLEFSKVKRYLTTSAGEVHNFNDYFAIKVDAGYTGKVEITYKNIYYTIGIFISVIAFIIALAAVVFPKKREQFRQRFRDWIPRLSKK